MQHLAAKEKTVDEEVEAAMMRAGAQIEALQREIDALRKDAERYRFAKTLLGQTIVMGVLREQGADVLDKVLDAAMAEEA